MMKEGLLFVVSTGVLIYFIAPVSEKEKTVPVKEEQSQKVVAPVEDDDDGWGDEGDDDEEEFVFGEPMTINDDEDDDDETDELSDGDDLIDSTDNIKSSSLEVAENSKSRSAHPDSPQGSERGSKENPIVFKTNNPEDPADD